jgi:hypothetical protein
MVAHISRRSGMKRVLWSGLQRKLWYAVVVALVLSFSAAAVLLAEEWKPGAGPGAGGYASTEELLKALRTVKGTLAEEGGVWTLETGKAAYVLHFGNWAYLAGTGMPLEKGKAVTVEGSVFDDDIVVFTANLEGKTYAFRDKNGVPLWAKYGPARRGPGGGDWDCGRHGPGGGDWNCGRRGGKGFCGYGRELTDRGDYCPRWQGR